MPQLKSISAFWSAIRDVQDNPLYQLEVRRRHRRRASGMVLALGLIPLGLCSCSWLVLCLLPVIFAVLAISREKSALTWESLLLTNMTTEEILVAKLASALKVPLIVILGTAAFGALFSTFLNPYHFLGTPANPAGLGNLLEEIDLVVVTVLLALLGLILFVLAAGLEGMLAGLIYKEAASAIIIASLFVGFMEGPIIAVSAALPTLFISDARRYSSYNGEDYKAIALPLGMFILQHAILATLLTYSCLRAIRKPAR